MTGIAGLNVERVTKWLAGNVDGAVAPFEFELITGGRSNLTFKVVDATGRAMVLRRPPTGSVLATAHDMEREHRIITAVGRTDVPVPRTLAVCRNSEVNDAPFYVMSYVEGVVLDSAEKGVLLSAERRRHAGLHLIDVLADLHAVDVDAVGLGDLARRDGYVERQVRRWTGQWEKSKTRELPAIDEVARRLAANVPEQQGVAIAHGDFRFGNCLVDIGRAEVAAVLDWELCTLGDPLADVGYLGVYWSDPGETQLRPNDPTGIEGFPTYAELVERYARRTGRDVSHIGYYRAFSSYRLAVITEGVYARYLHGAMGGQRLTEEAMDNFKAGVERLTDDALEALGADGVGA